MWTKHSHFITIKEQSKARLEKPGRPVFEVESGKSDKSILSKSFL